MKKLTAISGMLALLLFPTPCFTMMSEQEQTRNLLCLIAQRYTDFLSQFGQEEPGDLRPSMATLFAADCIKIVNDKVVSRSPEELYTQVSGAKNDIGLWAVNKKKPFIVDPTYNTVVAHYEIPTQNKGTLLVMKFLVCDKQGRIQKIDEVFTTLN